MTDEERRRKPKGPGALRELQKRGVVIPIGSQHGVVKLCFECDTDYTDAPGYTQCFMCGGVIETHEY